MRFLSLLCGVVFLLAGCESVPGLKEFLDSAPKPTADIKNVEFEDLSLESLKLNFKVDVDNPYPVPLPLTNIRYALAAGGAVDKAGSGAPLASGDIVDPGTLPANGTKTIDVPVELRFSEMLSAVKGLKLGQVLPYRANFDFSVQPPGTTTPLVLPLAHEGEVPVPAPPAVSLEKIEWEKLSLTQAKGVISMKVENPNDFGLDLSKLSYGLKLNGKSLVSGAVAEPLSFSAGKSQTVSVPVDLSTLQIGMAMFKVLQGGRADYALDGSMGVKTPFGAFDHDYAKKGVVPIQ